MRVSFTGTRRGMTINQWAKAAYQIGLCFQRDKPNEWHNGDAIGADHQSNVSVNNICKMFPEFNIGTYGHPCNIENQRAYDEYDIEYAPQPPLVRNRLMVDSTDILVAAPGEYDEVIRGSGTWATIRYAARVGRDHWIVWPDGSAIFKPGTPQIPDIGD